MVWTFLHAETAVVAGRFLLCHMENLELRLRMHDLEQVADDAERAEKNSPWNICSQYSGNIIYSEEHSDPYPELERVGNRSERTEITAPEHIYKEASENDYADGYD